MAPAAQPKARSLRLPDLSRAAGGGDASPRVAICSSATMSSVLGSTTQFLSTMVARGRPGPRAGISATTTSTTRSASSRTGRSRARSSGVSYVGDNQDEALDPRELHVLPAAHREHRQDQHRLHCLAVRRPDDRPREARRCGRAAARRLEGRRRDQWSRSSAIPRRARWRRTSSRPMSSAIRAWRGRGAPRGAAERCRGRSARARPRSSRVASARREDGVAVAALIGDADPAVAPGAITGLANGAPPRAHQDVVVAALTAVLADAELRGPQGGDLGRCTSSIRRRRARRGPGPQLRPARSPEPATQRNARDRAVARVERVERRPRARASPRTRAEAPCGYGAAWGRRRCPASPAAISPAIKAMFADDNPNVLRGLGAFLYDAKRRGRDISLAGQAFAELERDHPDDAMLHARIFAVREIVERGPDA